MRSIHPRKCHRSGNRDYGGLRPRDKRGRHLDTENSIQKDYIITIVSSCHNTKQLTVDHEQPRFIHISSRIRVFRVFSGPGSGYDAGYAYKPRIPPHCSGACEVRSRSHQSLTHCRTQSGNKESCLFLLSQTSLVLPAKPRFQMQKSL